jgi:hypothetical protein
VLWPLAELLPYLRQIWKLGQLAGLNAGEKKSGPQHLICCGPDIWSKRWARIERLRAFSTDSLFCSPALWNRIPSSSPKAAKGRMRLEGRASRIHPRLGLRVNP